jgi:hypothetical protein
VAPIRKTFIEPVARQQLQPVTEMPAAPELSAPNKENVIADLKIASAINAHKPFLAPAKTAPFKGTGVLPVIEPPQMAAHDIGEPGVIALISLPDRPIRVGDVVAVPPANQIATAHPGGRPGIQNAGSSGAGNGVWTGSDIEAGGGELPVAGTTRLTLPKNGKFGVVVTGTSAAAPYAESIGALSGKIVYSVFLDVGLRKRWLLQYCLPKTEEQKSGVKGHAEPLDAPWPYLIVRPNAVSATNADYVVVHGTITSDGRFDQLGLVFPKELDKKELLMSSLNEWTFRAATRDGAPAAVEILLIVPRQPD